MMAAQGQQRGTGFVPKHDFFAFPAPVIIDVVILSTPFVFYLDENVFNINNSEECW